MKTATQLQDLFSNDQGIVSEALSVSNDDAINPIPDIAVCHDTERPFQLLEQGTLKAEYIYNDAGQRTRKTVYQSDGVTLQSTTIYHYDLAGMLLTETTEQGQLIKDYLWHGNPPGK